MKYSDAVKVVLRDLNNIESLLVTEKSDRHVFRLRTYKGNEVNIDFAMFRTIAPMCRLHVAGMSVHSFLNKRIFIREDIKHLLNKIKIIEKQDGTEKYTEVMTERDEYLKYTLIRVQDTINDLLEEEK